MTDTMLDRRAVLAGLGASGLAACADAAPPPAPKSEAGLTWADAPALPEPVQEIYPTLHRGQIHLAGGFVAAGGQITGPTAAHNAFTPGEAAWSPLAPLPRSRHHPQLISFKGGLFAIGGFESPSTEAVWVMQSSAWAYDDYDDVWTDATALPQPSGECVTADLGGVLHLCGGRVPAGEANAAWTDHTDTDAHFVLISKDGAWETARPAPTKRNSAAAVVLDGAWHIVGGRSVAGGNTPVHEVYDPAEDRWRTAAPMPQGQGGLAAGLLNGEIVAFGGEFFDNGGGVYPETWIYDPAADAWRAGPDMRSPRHGLGGVTLGGRIYAIGGALRVGGSETSAVVETLEA
ncbi:MAG: galactose oxidase [Pseudomonadota bacterium]